MQAWEQTRVSALQQEMSRAGRPEDAPLYGCISRLQVLGAEHPECTFTMFSEEGQRAALRGFVRRHASLAAVLDWFGLDLSQDEHGFYAGDHVGVVRGSPAFPTVAELNAFCEQHLPRYEAICREGSTGPWFWQSM